MSNKLANVYVLKFDTLWIMVYIIVDLYSWLIDNA